MVAPARLLTVLSSLMATIEATSPAASPIVIWPAFVTVLLPAAKMPTPLSPRVMMPEAALTIVLFTPAKIPVLDGPAVSVPLLVTVLKSLTPMITPPPPSLRVAPGSTLTVRLSTPPPA